MSLLRRLRICARGGVVAIVLVAGCHRAPKPTESKTPARVVSISPSTTEAMFAIGAGKELVGRSRYCDYPPEAMALPQVGGYVDPSIEAILALRPDLVVGARGPAGPKLAETLEAHGVATFFPETESLVQIDELLRGLGQRTGHAEDADRTVIALDARERAIDEALAPHPKVRALLVFDVEPIVVAGPGGFPDEMLARAGGVNVVSEGGPYPSVGIERVIALDPEVILDTTVAAHGSVRIRADAPGWREVGAVKRGRVVPLADEAVLRPGPRIADGLAQIAHALHPDAALP
ncbi:MAG TPA: helical backbone metal receptor [Polyangiaceae bacterium]|jgi:iron complex transport system substrate-binding protein